MVDLAAFISARLDEDEATARATMRPTGPDWSVVAAQQRIPDGNHIARHDPSCWPSRLETALL